MRVNFKSRADHQHDAEEDVVRCGDCYACAAGERLAHLSEADEARGEPPEPSSIISEKNVRERYADVYENFLDPTISGWKESVGCSVNAVSARQQVM